MIFRFYSTIKFFANRTIIYLDKTCPKGTILLECGRLLQRGPPKRGEDEKVLRDAKGHIIREPYRIKVFNTINFKKSLHYNPFVYLHSEKDILKFVTALISNTKGDGKTGDEFWEKCEKLLYTALTAFILEEASQEEQNFATLMDLLNMMEVHEDDDG